MAASHITRATTVAMVSLVEVISHVSRVVTIRITKPTPTAAANLTATMPRATDRAISHVNHAATTTSAAATASLVADITSSAEAIMANHNAEVITHNANKADITSNAVATRVNNHATASRTSLNSNNSLPQPDHAHKCDSLHVQSQWNMSRLQSTQMHRFV